MLQMPGLIRKWIQTLDALLAKHRYMERLFSGSYRRDELDGFLEELTTSVNEFQALMRNPARCCFVPVMLAEPLSVSETLALVDELARLKVPATDIIINQLYSRNGCAACAGARARQTKEISNIGNGHKLSGFALWGVPFYPAEVRGSDALATFWGAATRISSRIS